MSKGLKVVFVAFTQDCIQSNVTHDERVKSVLCIKEPLASPKYAVRAHNIFTHNFLNIQLIFNPCASFDTSNITNHIEITTNHVQTSLLVKCAGGVSTIP